MNQLWPRLSHGAARIAMEEILAADKPPSGGSSSHGFQTFAATGGKRVLPKDVASLAAAVEEIAARHGFPEGAPSAERIAFDREAAEVIFESMEITSFEASQPGVWTFMAVVALPHITHWRFGFDNLERWVASDLTRHMFSRLWWQAFTFGVPRDGSVDYGLLRGLSERDLNQLTERRSIGGNQRLARAIAAEILSDRAMKTNALRLIAKRVRRLTAFIDFASLDDHVIRSLVKDAVSDIG